MELLGVRAWPTERRCIRPSPTGPPVARADTSRRGNNALDRRRPLCRTAAPRRRTLGRGLGRRGGSGESRPPLPSPSGARAPESRLSSKGPWGVILFLPRNAVAPAAVPREITPTWLLGRCPKPVPGRPLRSPGTLPRSGWRPQRPGSWLQCARVSLYVLNRVWSQKPHPPALPTPETSASDSIRMLPSSEDQGPDPAWQFLDESPPQSSGLRLRGCPELWPEGLEGPRLSSFYKYPCLSTKNQACSMGCLLICAFGGFQAFL